MPAVKRDTLSLSADGAAIHVHVWTPEAQARGFVQILHGLAEHSARYEGLAAALCEAGFAAIAHDHRGHGKTAASADELGFFAEREGWKKVVGDVARVRGYARERFPGVPWALFAHSMGTVVGMHDLATSGEAPTGVVLSGATGKVGPLLTIGRGLIRVELRRLGPRGRSKLLNATAFGAYNRAFRPNRTEFDWLSRDNAQVDAYVADPFCGFVSTAQLWSDFVAAQAELQTKAFLARLPRVPYFMFCGDRDPVSAKGRQVRAIVEMMRGVGLAVDLHLWPGGRHEMLNETNRDEVIASTVQWLTARLCPPS